MDHRYFVSEDNYITALEYTFKRKMRRPNWLAFRFICTFGQLLLCVACVLDGSFKGKTAFFIIGASLVLFGLSSIYFRGAKMQAKADFRRMMNRKQIPEEFWKQHTLRLGGGKIRLKYGKKDFELDNWLVKAVEFRNSVLLLSGGNVVDIIPTEALNYNSEYIIEKLRNERLSGAVQTAAKAKKELPEEKRAEYNYRCSREQYFRAQCQAMRRFYMSRYSLSVIRITLWILTGLLIWYTVLHFSLMALLICIYVCLFINARYVIVMTPLVKFAVKQNADALPEFLPGEESVIYVLENEIVISGEAYCLGIPGQEIVAVMDIPSGIAICTAKGVYFTIPEPDADNEEKFCKLKIELKRLKVQRSH